jgi:RNA polymerase sigma-70 factor (ECF subfamily)
MKGTSITYGGQSGLAALAPSELELCQRIARGEKHLFAQVIDTYSGLVASAIAAQGVERSEVEDLAQLAFINAYKGMAGFRGDAKLSSWLYRIATNVAKQHQKRRAVRPSVSSVEEAMESGRHPVDERGDTTRIAVRNRVLAAALGELPLRQRECLMLYYMEELTYEEIAEALGLNLNTVRTQIRRGKQKLAAVLESAEYRE